MKKILSLLFTLLIFVGNAWAWTEGVNDNDDAINVNKSRTYDLPAGKSNPTEFDFSVASGTHWFSYDVEVHKYSGTNYQTEKIHFNGGDLGKTYHSASVSLDKTVTKVAIKNINSVANVYIHDVVWKGDDPSTGNCTDSYKSKIDDTTIFGDKTATLFSNNTRRRPVITFTYKATKFGSIKGKIELLVNGSSVWSTDKYGLEGDCLYQCTGNKNTIAIRYWGKVNVSNIKLTQASYAEIKDKADISFGEMKTIGSTWSDKSFNIQWASYDGKVTCTSNQFTVTPNTFGNSAKDCTYSDDQTITVKFTPTLPGLHTAYVYVGNDRVKVTGEAQLAKPVVTAAASGMKDITVSWNKVTGAESYNLYYYGQDTPIAEGLTSTSYHVGNLTQNTEYGFVVKAISGVGAKYDSDLSDKATARTYSKLTVEKESEFAAEINYTVKGESGKWNQSETSFAYNSKATVTATCTNSCAVFDKIKVGSNEYKTNPAVITITAPATASVYYKFKGLDKPVASVSENNSISNISIEWNVVECSDTYTIFKNGEKVASGVTESTYNFTSLSEATDYTFYVKAVRGGEESVSETISATTNTTSMLVTVNGPMGIEDVSYNITSDKWNISEKSYAIGSTATVAVSQLPADCVVETIVANGADVSATAKFTVEESNTVIITYRYTGTGVAEVVDAHGEIVYGTLTDAVNAAEEGATINLLGDVEQDMVVSKYIKFNGNGHDIDNLYINKDGNVELTGDVTVVKDFGLEVSAARSGQFLENGGQIQVTGRAYIDKVLEENGVGDYNKWYSVAVPFQVSIKDGIYIVGNDGSETKAKFNSDYAMFEYDGALRAAGTSRLPEWALADSEKNMKVGTFYLFGLGKSGPNVFRFYKADNAELITLDKTLTLTEYASSKSIDAGWNGIGNSQLYHVGIETTEYQYAQVLENNKFTTVDIAETSFAVTTPMFIQAAGDGSVSLNPKKDGTLRSASVSSAVYNIRLAKEGAEKYSDQMFASASSDATGSYTIGRDLVKFEVSTAYPQLYTRGFNTNLSVHEAAYNELSIAEMPLYMFAPEAGNYTLSLGKEVSDGSALYLVKNGAEIHNFNADGDYTLYLAKGTDSSYTLRIKGENGDIPTPVIDNKAGKVNVYIEEGVLVIEGLDNGESYMVGNTIRTLYSGVSSGNNIRIALPERGIYLVNAKESKVKILNK